MIAACFVDASVFVYASDRADPRKQQVALSLLERLWREQSGRTSTQVLNEYYTIVTRKLDSPLAQDAAWREVEELLQWNPQALDANLLGIARQLEARYRLSWWDAQIIAAAKAQSCAVIYTEDLQNGAVLDGVRVSNPFLMPVQDAPPPEYKVRRVDVHRPRGRPRRQAAL